MNNKDFTLRVLLPQPPKVVWSVLTDLHHMQQWFLPKSSNSNPVWGLRLLLLSAITTKHLPTNGMYGHARRKKNCAWAGNMPSIRAKPQQCFVWHRRVRAPGWTSPLPSSPLFQRWKNLVMPAWSKAGQIYSSSD